MIKPKTLDTDEVEEESRYLEWYPADEMNAWLDSEDNRFLTDLELHELQHASYDKGCEDIAFSKDVEWRKKITETLKAYKDYPVSSESEARLLQSIYDNFGNLLTEK